MRGVAMVCVLAAAMAAALAGCSGGGKSPANSAAAACGGTGKSATPAAASNNIDVSELNALAKRFCDASFKAQYNLSGTGTSPLNGTMTLLKGGQNRFRFDVTTAQDGTPTSLTSIQTKSRSVFCLQDAGELAPLLGLEPGKGVCFNNDPTSGASGLQDLTDTFQQLAGGDVTVTGKSTRTVAGQQGQCYAFTDNSTGDKSETCFSADGVPLYDRTTTAADSTTIEATSVQPTVNDSDFNIPYQVKDLPSLDGTSTP